AVFDKQTEERGKSLPACLHARVTRLNKPIAVVVIVVLLGLASLALIFSGTIAGSMTGGGATTSLSQSQISSTRITSLNQSQVSSIRTTSGNISTSFQMNMNVVPTLRLVPLGGSANYTVVLYNNGNLTGSY